MGFMQVELDGSSICNLQIQAVVRAEQATFNFCTAIGRSHYFLNILTSILGSGEDPNFWAKSVSTMFR
jgi:hypothetical protein